VEFAARRFEPLPTWDEFAWIEQLPLFTGRDRTRPGHRLRQYLPEGFDAYLRVFHPYFPMDTQPTDADLASKRVTWREVADAKGLVFHPEMVAPIWWSNPDTNPDGITQLNEGEPDPWTESALFSVLAPDDETDVFCVVGHPGMEQLYKVKVRDIRLVKAVNRADGPLYAWPEDRSWVMYINSDAFDTYIACDSATSGAMLANENLEVLRVTLDTRCDGKMDQINGQKDLDWNSPEADGWAIV